MVKGKQLTNAIATYVSLVDKGANQIPFKVIKSDESGSTKMKLLDLAGLGTRVTKGFAAPEVIAIASTNPDTDAVTLALKSAGFNVIKTQKSAGEATLYISEEVEDASLTHTVKMSDGTAVVLKGFNSWADDLIESANFSDILAATSFFYSISDASNALSTTLRALLEGSSNPQEAKNAAATILQQYTEYVLAQIGGLPTIAFKADAAIANIVKADEAPAAVVTPVAEVAPVVEITPTTVAGAVATETVAEVAAVAEVTPAAEVAPEAVQKAEDPMLQVLKGFTEAMTQGFTNLGTLLGDKIQAQTVKSDTAIESLTTTVAGIDVKIQKSVEDAVTAKTKGITLSGVVPVDTTNAATVTKKAFDNGPIDTAYERRS